MKLFKSIAAILAGILFVFVLSTGTDLLLENLNVFPPIATGKFATWMLVLALAYRCIYEIAAGYIAASIAPKKRMRHVMILGYLGLTISIVGAITSWYDPHQWYPIALAITSLPCVWLGGMIRKWTRSLKRA